MARPKRTTAHRLRPVLTACLLAGGLLAAGCTAPLPEVGFFGNRQSTATGPSLWCSVDATATAAQCAVDRADDGAARLGLRPGQGIQVSVPPAIGDQPWTVVFRYTDATGVHDARTAVFEGGSRLAYVLPAPSADATIDRVEVQSGLTLVQGQDGGVDVAVLRTWVLVIQPEPARA